MSNQLFFLSLADIFSVYPTIFNEITSSRGMPKTVYLPSDADWQERVYYRLLEVQKRINEAIEGGMTFEEVIRRKDNPVFDSQRISPISVSVSPCGVVNGHRNGGNRKLCRPSIARVNVQLSTVWTLDNIAKAAKLLKKPPLSVNFENEHEMRRVYSLIYDVFRYKVILANALDDVSFYELHPQYVADQSRIWLMLFELYHRSFKKRSPEDLIVENDLYIAAEVKELSDSLWNIRIPLAASISRMRIRYGALRLSQLLPIHLQNEKVAIAASNPVVTGWINPFLLRNKTATEDYLGEMGFEIKPKDPENVYLLTQQYEWDNICPLFISCIPKDRNEFSKSKFMSANYFVLQDKTFAFGPAVMSKLLDYFELDGDILQTHISSPKSTAYLASLFYSVNRVNTFYVYGAGSDLKEYRKYMEGLGITNIRIFAESFTSIPLESNRFGTVVGIFANPPNSFSAISDPIDLICSRGGDLGMLEILTESEISDDGRHRVALILEEQLLTLRMSMSRPHIQFVLYQTHSLVNTENQDMVKYVVELVNSTSLQKHKQAHTEKRRLEALLEAEAANIPAAAMAASPRKRTADEKGKADGAVEATAGGGHKSSGDENEDAVHLPDTDEYIIEDIPDVCTHRDECMKSLSTGCFLALVRRRNLTHLNAKYLIRMAEKRGLFGKSDPNKNVKTKTMKTQETILEKTEQSSLCEKREKSNVDINSLIDRINRDTKASLIRSHLFKISLQNAPITFNYTRRECSRYLAMIAGPRHRAKYLWRCAFHYVIQMKSINFFNAYDLCKLSAYKNLRKTSVNNRTPFPISVNEVKVFENDSLSTSSSNISSAIG